MRLTTIILAALMLCAPLAGHAADEAARSLLLALAERGSVTTMSHGPGTALVLGGARSGKSSWAEQQFDGASASELVQLLVEAGAMQRRLDAVVTAVTGAVGLGLADFSAARTLSEVTAEFTPDAARHAVYARRHARFTDAYTALAPWFAGREA